SGEESVRGFQVVANKQRARRPHIDMDRKGRRDLRVQGRREIQYLIAAKYNKGIVSQRTHIVPKKREYRHNGTWKKMRVRAKIDRLAQLDLSAVVQQIRYEPRTPCAERRDIHWRLCDPPAVRRANAVKQTDLLDQLITQIQDHLIWSGVEDEVEQG